MVVANHRDRVVPRLIEDEMKQSFLDYSMSVIVQRALPDVRDGLKPVHRRILYAMHEAGLGPTRPFKKCATVVGDVLGKYHPHGDSAVYDALVRMVQEFSLRYPLIQGQGNFGSVDGDSAAAYRYTEARLAPLAGEMLADIDKETVDFSPNFDDRLTEPTVLPAKLPNLLVNGSSGIAVGMSTNIPPHNLREVVGAATYLLDHPDCSIEELMQFIPGPDFPTGGLIMGADGIRKAYHTGRGRVVMRARVAREQRRGGKEQLVVTEIPYSTNKTRIVEQIAGLVKKGKVSDISDLRDESDRDGIRIVIELKRGVDARKTLEKLFRWTSLQNTFGVITLALENGAPREFSLKALLEHFRDHRIEMIVRRSEWELTRARDEVHVLEGLLIALDAIEETVRLIRGSKTRETAAAKLIKRFKLSERQAGAILDMRLVRLTALETRDLRARLERLEARIRELGAILATPERQIAVIRAELDGLAAAYGDARRTTIISDPKSFKLEDLLANEEVVVALSREGFIKQIPMSLYRRRVNSGRPLAGMERYDTDYLERLFVAGSNDTLMFFTAAGQAYWLPVQEIPEAGRSSRGRSLQQLLGLGRDERVVSMLVPPRAPANAIVVFSTAKGTVKRTALEDFNARAGGVNAINLAKGDHLLDVQLSDGTADLVLVTKRGRSIRFEEEDVAVMGRVAQGVKGINLAARDEVVGIVVVRRDAGLCVVTAKGFAHRVLISELPLQKRGGLGSMITELSARTGSIVAAKEMLHGDQLMVLSTDGEALRIRGEDLAIGDRGAPPRVDVGLAAGAAVAEVTRAAAPGPNASAAGEPEPSSDEPAAVAVAAEAGEAGEPDSVTSREPGLQGELGIE